MSLPSSSSFLQCAAVLLMASASCVTAALDNPAFTTRLGIPCTTSVTGNLDCRQFGVLGMTDLEVQELIDNCPCACKDIQCTATEGEMSSNFVQQGSTDQTGDEIQTENTASSSSTSTAPTAPVLSQEEKAVEEEMATEEEGKEERGKEGDEEDDEEEMPKGEGVATEEDDDENEVVDLLKQETMKEEQPAATDNGTFSTPPENNGGVSKTAVKTIVPISLIGVALMVFCLYRRHKSSGFEEKGQDSSDESDGTMSRDESMPADGVPPATIPATNECIAMIDP